MADPRIEKFAALLIHYSLDIQPGQQLSIVSTPLAEELLVEVYAAALRAGANVLIWMELPQMWEIFYKNAQGDQLDHVSPLAKLVAETFDARLTIEAEQNTRTLTNVDPAKMARRAKAYQPVNQHFYERAARNELRWCSTLYPTHAAAQEADMSLSEYREFVFEAGKLNEPDPLAVWQTEEQRLGELCSWLAGKDQVAIQGTDIDLRLSIKGRPFIPSDGKYNFPDGEIFTGPVEDSVNGWVRFRYPAIYAGHEVDNIELWFENGKVIRETASKGQEFLTSLLDTDPGARYLGEWGIGTNYHITRFSKNMLFDEKIGGTIHLALGASYPETGGRNESGIHWDMLCDMSASEITLDGELFYRDGKPVV